MSAYLILAMAAMALPGALAVLWPWPGLPTVRMMVGAALAPVRRIPAWAWSLLFLLFAGLSLEAAGLG